ncbi:MAG: hypothetical protein WCG47_18165 [Dermatophilaceae bacterium]
MWSEPLAFSLREPGVGEILAAAAGRGDVVVRTLCSGVSRGTETGVPKQRPGEPVCRAALGCWLGDGDLRQRLRGAAHERRVTLSRWAATAHRIISRIPAEGAV